MVPPIVSASTFMVTWIPVTEVMRPTGMTKITAMMMPKMTTAGLVYVG
jgi:hypothetical protein